MAKINAPLLAFNRGLVSSSALVRVDVERMRLSAEVMTNWLPKTAGSMFLRPGLGYIGAGRNDAYAIDIPFVAATDDTALIEMADGKMRVRVNDVLISRVAVSTTISNSAFATSTNWTDGSSNGGTLTFGATGLVLNAVNYGGIALCRREITVSGGDANKRHALNIVVTRGPVTFRCGSASGGDEYIAETVLRTGYHSLALTPTGNFWVQFQSTQDVDRIVASCQVATAGTMELDIPYSSGDLQLLRWSQSADVVFVASGYQQRRIERRSTDSWSLVLYAPDKPPFFASRTAGVKLKAGATRGNTTLTADRPFFKAGHVGSVFRLFNEGVERTFNIGAGGTFTDPFRVTGVFASSVIQDRRWKFGISGTWSGTLFWQRSFDGKDTGFQDFRDDSSADAPNGITTNVSYPTNNEDTDSNSVIWYRIGFKEGGYSSGTAVIRMTYGGGGSYGLVRVLAVNSSTSADVEVIQTISNSAYTDNWQESVWSEKQGWPVSVEFHKGRLWWAGKSRFIGSVADDYENFDPEFEGDAGPINRTLGRGPVDTINFMLSLGQLIIGTPGAEFSIKSTSFDEPLTPQNVQASDPSTQGSRAGANAAKVDNRGVFAQRSGKNIFELVFDPDGFEYRPHDLTLLCPKLTGAATVVGMAVQRQPDTRIHVWLSDGTVVLLTYEPSEEVNCWSRIETDGYVERITVLPGESEDQVYYRVRRTINGQTKRYLEKVALESECQGGSVNKQADAFIVVPSVTGTAVSGLSHLEGKQVVAWASGKDMGTYTVSSGAITLSSAVSVTDVLVGLGYEASYKSTKLAYAASAGTALGQVKRVNMLAVILGLVHNNGLEFGGDFTTMDRLPRLYRGRPVEVDEVFSHYEEGAVAFPGEWNTDSRLCLRANAPRPCVVEAAIVSVETNDRL